MAAQLEQRDVLRPRLESSCRGDSRFGNQPEERLKVPSGNVQLHLIKWEIQPDRRSRSWEDSISNSRREVDSLLDSIPSLRTYLNESFERCDDRAFRSRRPGNPSARLDILYAMAHGSHTRSRFPGGIVCEHHLSAALLRDQESTLCVEINNLGRLRKRGPSPWDEELMRDSLCRSQWRPLSTTPSVVLHRVMNRDLRCDRHGSAEISQNLRRHRFACDSPTLARAPASPPTQTHFTPIARIVSSPGACFSRSTIQLLHAPKPRLLRNPRKLHFREPQPRVRIQLPRLLETVPLQIQNHNAPARPEYSGTPPPRPAPDAPHGADSG